MIDKELRFRGRLIKIFNNTFTITRLRIFNRLMRKYRMRIKDNSISIENDLITRNDGSEMRICIFKPKKSVENVPGILWLHGGGYAIGAPEQAKKMAKHLIETSNCVVVAPDYTLSIQKPYPAALEDCYAALLWMKANAKELGANDQILMVGGESAGGGLTAALTLYARDKGEVKIAFQMPLYPMIDDRMTEESVKHNNGPVWNSKSTYNGWKLYLGDKFGKKDVPIYAAPARSVDYSNLPPAAIYVGALEPFKDETIQYVNNLKKAGVPVSFKIFNGCYHGFDVVCPNAKISKEAIDFLMEAFKSVVDHLPIE